MTVPPMLDRLTGEISAALGRRLVAFLVYGSTVRGDAGPDADVNTLLICDAADEAVFDALEPAVARWVAAGHPAPLVVSADEWRDATDAFAIEYSDIQEAHRVLAGRDPWDGIAITRADVRRQLEHELRGKVLRLRQGYLAARGDGRALENLVRATAAGWLVMLRAALRLSGREAPGGVRELVTSAAAVVGFPAEPAASVVADSRSRAPLHFAARDPRAAAYVAAVGRTADYVNALS